jgi:hypothetical protein
MTSMNETTFITIPKSLGSPVFERVLPNIKIQKTGAEVEVNYHISARF